MKKLRLKGLDATGTCSTRIQQCIKTVDGYEDVHVNMATGEITYTPGTCTDDTILREAFLKEGFEVEEIKRV